MPHKKGYQVCIFKTNELLLNTFEAINQQNHFLSTDGDIIAFKFLHGATHTSRVQPRPARLFWQTRLQVMIDGKP